MNHLNYRVFNSVICVYYGQTLHGTVTAAYHDYIEILWEGDARTFRYRMHDRALRSIAKVCS
jgi:hypothetical protein